MANILLFIVLAIVGAGLGYLAFNALLTRRLAARAEREVPMSGQLIEIGDDRLHVVEVGQGCPILFIHGLGAQLHHFTGTVFDGLRGDFRLIAVDRPGSGYSVRGAGSTAALVEQAGSIAELIDRLGLAKPLVVGHSLGGMIALTLALEHPQKVGGLALLSPLTHPFGTPPAVFAGLRIQSQVLRKLISHTLAVPASARLAEKTLAAVFGPQAATPDYMTKGGGWLGLRPSHFEATVVDYLAAERDVPALSLRYEEIKVPTGILYGDQDGLLDYREQGLAMAGRIDDVEIELLPGIGHMPQFVEQAAVEAFIRKMAARSMLDVIRQS